MMQIVRAADWKPTPWKNGGGITNEIAISPTGAGMDDFSWRLSAARVDQSGPFSLFAGIDRTLCILTGDGLELTGPVIGTVKLHQGSPPFSFSADDQVSAVLLGESILDLNIMTRRESIRHEVKHLWVSEDVNIEPDLNITVLFSLGAAVKVTEMKSSVKLGWGDIVIVDTKSGGVTVSVDCPSQFIQITLSAD